MTDDTMHKAFETQFCPYNGSPDPWVVWQAAWQAALASAAPAAGWGPGRPITEEMHVAACKVLARANGLDGTPQRMMDAMLAAAPTAPAAEALTEIIGRIETYAKGIHERIDGPDYFGDSAPAGLKNGPLYDAADRACWILNCVKEARVILAATAQAAPVADAIEAGQRVKSTGFAMKDSGHWGEKEKAFEAAVHDLMRLAYRPAAPEAGKGAGR